MGLPGSGKTTLANELGPMLNAKRLNADEVRKKNLQFWKGVMLEDVNVIEGMQNGRNSPAYNGGNFSPIMDLPTHQFHKWVAGNLI